MAEMTGMEAWHLVAPLIAAHSAINHARTEDPALNPLDEAYIIIFAALKDFDERKKNG